MATKKIWLCRDWDGSYVICQLAKRPKRIGGDWCQVDRKGWYKRHVVGERDFESQFPKIKGKLKPRDGPIQIELMLKICDE